MSLRQWLRATIALTMLVLPMLVTGCSDNPRESGGGKASGTTDGGGPVTTASPGGPNVGPAEGTNAGVR